MMNILVKSILVFGLLTLVEDREWLESGDTIRNEKEGQSSDENENVGDFISKIRTVGDRSRHLNENTEKSTLNEDQSRVVLSGCLQQEYELHQCRVNELAKLVEKPPKPGAHSCIPQFVCPPHFTYLASSNKCYKLEWDQMDWTEAGIRCRSLHRDAHLVVVDDAAEQAAIVTYLTSLKERIQKDCYEGSVMKVWNAGQRIDPSRNSMFMWKPFDNMLEMRYTNWMPGEPNFGGSKESCAHFHSYPDMKWNDVVCRASDNVYDAGYFYYKQCPLCEIDL